jgi:hypothetical protein
MDVHDPELMSLRCNVQRGGNFTQTLGGSEFK